MSLPTRGRGISHGRLSCSWTLKQSLSGRYLVKPSVTLRRSSSTAKSSGGALEGVRILDLSRVLAGPYCTQILADYGADVIKVEDVGRGDDTRYFRVKDEDAAWKDDIGPMSNYFAAINRNKRSMCLNLKSDQGKEILFKLAKKADVVIENFRPGAMERLGLGFETLSAVNPRLIHATISGYGPTGPFAKRAGYDMIAGAEAGLLHLTGERDGPPVRSGIGITDLGTGLYAHGAIMAALFARERTGRGQKVDASLFESQVALLVNYGTVWMNLEQESQRWGTQHPSVVPYDAFKTKDLYFVCGAVNDKQFATLCRLLGVEDLLEDARFKTNATRVSNRDELMPRLREAFATKTTDEWNEAFEGSGMPYASINTMERVFKHPQALARGMVADVEFESVRGGSLKLIGPAVKFSDTEATIRTRPPLLGEHTQEILSEIGLSGDAVKELKETGVVA